MQITRTVGDGLLFQTESIQYHRLHGGANCSDDAQANAHPAVSNAGDSEEQRSSSDETGIRVEKTGSTLNQRLVITGVRETEMV